MLNDYGKGLLKPWLSVQNVVLVLVAIFVIALFDLSSSELASWVQAIGSVVAIMAAVWISSSQRREQINKDKLRERLEFEMVKTLAERADRAVPFNDLSPVNMKSSQNMISGLRLSFEAINLLALPRSSLVEPICTIRDALRAIEAGAAIADKAGNLVNYVSSTECCVWFALVKASSKQIVNDLT